MKAVFLTLLALAMLALVATSNRAARGEPFDLKAFHDDFMSRGAPPVPWIGRRMLNDPEWHPFR